MPKVVKKPKMRSDGRYQQSVTIGKSQDGKLIRKVVYGKTLQELNEKMTTLRMEVKHKNIIVDGNMILSDWCNEWVKTYKRDKEDKTIEVYEYSIGYINNEDFGIGKYRLCDINSHMIQSFINKLIEKNLTRTIEMVYNTLCQLFKRARINNFIYSNPMDSIDKPKIKKNKKSVISDDDVKRIVNADIPLKERCLTLLFLFCGLRKGEALALTVNDINFKTNQVNVNKTLIIPKSGASYIRDMTKTLSGIREVYLPTILLEPLSELVESVKSEGIEQLFTTREKKLYYSSSFYRYWNKVKQKTGVTCTPHDLRHKYATLLYYSGVDLKAAQSVFGHSDVDLLLNLYTHLDKDKAKLTISNKVDQYINESFKENP